MRTTKNKKEKILGVARRLFSTKSYDSVSMDMIAKSAGVSKGCLYIYFKSKAELCAALFESNLQLFRNILTDILARKVKAREKLELLFERFIELAGGERPSFFFPAAREFSPEVHRSVGRKILPHIEFIRQAITQLFEQGIKEGAFRDYPADELALLFLGMLFSMSQRTTTIESMRKHFLPILYNGILKG
jgi:AcrR family transcriptional regulator